MVYKLYLIAKAWLDLAVAGKRGVDSLRGGVRRVVATGLATTGGIAMAAVAVGVMLILWVTLSYTMGNGASYLVFDNIPLSGPRIEPFLSWRRDDWVSQFVFQGSIVLAIMSIILGVKGKSAEWIAWLLILPWCLFGFVVGALAAFYGIGAVYNWSSGLGFAVDIYGVRVNPVVYAALALAAFGYSRVALLIARAPRAARDIARTAMASRSS